MIIPTADHQPDKAIRGLCRNVWPSLQCAGYRLAVQNFIAKPAVAPFSAGWVG